MSSDRIHIFRISSLKPIFIIIVDPFVIGSTIFEPVIFILTLIFIFILIPQTSDHLFLYRFERSNIIKAFKLFVRLNSILKEAIKNKDKVKISNSFILFFDYLLIFRLK